MLWQRKSIIASLSKYILFQSAITQYENSCCMEINANKWWLTRRLKDLKAFEKQSTVKYLQAKTCKNGSLN